MFPFSLSWLGLLCLVELVVIITLVTNSSAPGDEWTPERHYQAAQGLNKVWTGWTDNHKWEIVTMHLTPPPRPWETLLLWYPTVTARTLVTAPSWLLRSFRLRGETAGTQEAPGTRDSRQIRGFCCFGFVCLFKGLCFLFNLLGWILAWGGGGGLKYWHWLGVILEVGLLYVGMKRLTGLRLAWALFVLLSTFVYCQSTELIWAFFFFFFS